MNRRIISAGAVVLSVATAVALSPVAAATAASTSYPASAGFSSTQGGGGWTYSKSTASGTSRLSGYDAGGQRWQESAGYPWVSATAMHPENSAAAVRSWTAPTDGTVSVSGAVSKGDAVGDGVVASVRLGAETLWSATVTGTTAVPPTGVSGIAVRKGETISFVVDKNRTMSNDHTFWNPTITVTSPASDQPAGSLSVTTYGATAGDSSDDAAAFRAALSAASAQQKSLWVPQGTFRLGGVLSVEGVTVQGAGRGETILLSTDPGNGSIDLSGAGVGLRDLTHRYASLSVRDGRDTKNSVTVRNAPDFSITGVHIIGASTAGILTRQSSGVISGNVIEGTQADGIHMTERSSDITVSDNVVKDVGDDTIAVVSYRYQPGVSHDITIRDNDVGYGSDARGISVVGGEDVTITGNTISTTRMAGLYLSVEAEYDTMDTLRIDVEENTVDRTPVFAAGGHASVLVYGSQGRMDEISFTGNLVTDASNSAFGVWGGGDIEDVYFTGNTVRGSGGSPTNFQSGVIHSSGNTGF